MDYKNMTIDDIIKWCQENNQVAWLKAKAAEQVECKVYPRVKGADGKVKADKTQAPMIEKRAITYVQIKSAFIEKFMPELAPKKSKAPSMYDKIAAL